jgi:multidrug efflux system membrane fusion protein
LAGIEDCEARMHPGACAGCSPMKPNPVWQGLLLAVLLVLPLILILTACREDESAAAPEAPLTISVAQPLEREITDWDEFTGRFVSVERVDLRARVSGVVEAMNFTGGQLVREGDVLFHLDARPFQTVVAEAEGRLAETRSQLVLAEREQERTNSLLSYRAATQQNVEQRTQGVAAARALVMQADAGLQRARLNLEFTTVRAPQAGRIGRHLVSPGNLVSGGEASTATLLATIVTIDPIDLVFDIDQAALLRYVRLAEAGTRPSSRDVANPVEMALADEIGFPHSGQVVFVDNEADAGTGTLRLRARFANPAQLFTPGQFARVRLLGSAAYRAVMIPDSAITTDQSRRVVYVVGPENTVAMREVQLGPLHDGLRVIRSGIAAADAVVVGGIPRVRGGMPVTPEQAPPLQPMPARPVTRQMGAAAPP